MAQPRRDADIRQWVDVYYSDSTSLEKDRITRQIVSEQIGAAYQRGEITLDQWHNLQREYGELHTVTATQVLTHIAETGPGWISAEIMSAGSDIGNVLKEATKIVDDVARMTSEEDDPFTFSDDGEFHDRQDESIDLWDDISVEAEVTTGDDDIQVVDDIEVIDETMIDEGWFYDDEGVPDLNPVDDFEDWVYPVEYDVKDDDVEDYISYPEQEIDDAVSFVGADDQHFLSRYGLTDEEYLDYVSDLRSATGIEDDDVLYDFADDLWQSSEIFKLDMQPGSNEYWDFVSDMRQATGITHNDTLLDYVSDILDQTFVAVDLPTFSDGAFVVDLPTFSDDTFIDIVNELTEDHMNVESFQFFDSDNIIFDKF